MRIAMIGTRGIPATAGGFETAVDAIATRLVERGHEVIVYNRTPDNAYQGSEYRGVRIVRLPTLRSKHLGTIVHAFLSTLHMLFANVDVVHYYVAGAGVLSFIPRLFGKRTVCSVDGLDWNRKKWGRFASIYLKASERVVASLCDAVITDARVMADYYQQRYGRTTDMIAYGARLEPSEGGNGGDGGDYLQRFGLEPRKYLLFVGRLVPEKNVHSLIAAFNQLDTDMKLVIAGDDPFETEYVAKLKREANDRVVFTGFIYGAGYMALQSNAYVFVLPAEVGGTPPVLVEAMGCGNCVLVSNTSSHLEVIADAGFSFDLAQGADDLLRQLRWLLANPGVVAEYREKALAWVKRHYTWDAVVDAHEALYRRLLGWGAVQEADPAAEAAAVAVK